MHSSKSSKIAKPQKLEPGDKVSIEKSGERIEGTIMPKNEFSKEDSVIVKRTDGYNIGLELSNHDKIKLVSKKEIPVKQERKKIEFDPKKPVISILHTGGTIASRVDYKTGGVIASFSPEEIMEMYPELRSMANIKSRLISNMWSEDMRFEHYQKIASAVADEIKAGADGVIITHGTDTLHYTSAALALMLQNLPVPVLLVGAQRSSDRGSSDAFMNLTAAAKFIAQSDFSGVAICMHENLDDKNCIILPACRTRKLHSCRRDAFKAVDADAIARVGDKIEFLSDYNKKDKNRKLEINDKFEDLVSILKIHPNMDPKIISCYKNYKGIVIEGTGLGHAPSEHGNEKFFSEMKKLSKNTILAMTTQTIYGSVNMNVYTAGRKYMQIGVIPCQMTTETAFIKLAWILGNFPKAKSDEIKRLMLENIAGEISQ